MVTVVVSQFGDLLKRYREAQGWTGRDGRMKLAKAAGISYQTVRRYEEGESNPDHEYVLRLARALGPLTLRPLLEAAGYSTADIHESPEIAELTAEERLLIMTFRRLQGDAQRRSLRTWQRLVEDEESADG